MRGGPQIYVVGTLLFFSQGCYGSFDFLPWETDQDAGMTDAAVTVAAGEVHACAISNGALYCWGRADRTGAAEGMTATPPTLVLGSMAWKSVSAGAEHSCAITAEGALYCWGAGETGALGNGNMTTSRTPTQESMNATDWTEVSVGPLDTCALNEDGSIYCWGTDIPCSETTTPADPEPFDENSGRVYKAVAVGDHHVCAITMDDELFCFGDNDDGQLGDGSNASACPAQVAGSWTHVAAGPLAATCAIEATTRHLYCWGAFIPGASGSSNVPLQIGGDTGWLAVSVGPTHMCGIQEDQRLTCLAAEGPPQPGVTDPTPGATGENWSTVAAGIDLGCGVRDGRVYCWGLNHLGQTGQAASGMGSAEPMEVLLP